MPAPGLPVPMPNLSGTANGPVGMPMISNTRLKFPLLLIRLQVTCSEALSMRTGS